jgi:Na+-translocating ferredoxin:NAD+ oxidoreductase RnfC subunit
MKKVNQKWSGPTTVKPHPMREGRRPPIQSLMKKLNIAQYAHAAPWQSSALSPRRVVLPLKQGAGVACQSLVRAGDTVSAGQAVGAIPDKALGAMIHAPFAGIVSEVASTHLTLNRS